jgi:membrane-bound lytic murein transglycosylase B
MYKNPKSPVFLVAIFSFILLFSLSTNVFAQSTNLAINSDERAALELELKQLEAESAKIQADLDNKKGERKGLEGELSLISSKIAESKNKIAKTQTTIKKLAVDINQKETKIQTLSQRINKNIEYISSSLVDMRKLDDIRAVIAFSGDQNFSELWQDFGDYKAIQGRLAENMDNLKSNKKFVEVEKEVLVDKKDETEALKKKQEQDKKEEEVRSKEKKQLISLTKQQEKDYETVLAAKKKKAAEIKTRLFSFAGGQTAAIPFEKALVDAEIAQRGTGVPAAFILAILTQESALGANVGKCYLTDTTTGAGINTKTNAIMYKVMKPTRDVQPFINITSALGFDWKKTIVSCPIAGIGYGGAMGPAQFIASTWQSIANRVKAITGSSNPWDAEDSIVGSATYLSDLGASTSYLSQIKAACKYYGTGGSNCSYGRQVMAKVNKIQNDIDYLKQYGTKSN